MKNHKITLPQDAVDQRAALKFAEACGFDGTKPKYAKMLEQAREALEKGKNTLRPAAVVSAYPGSVIQGDTAVLDGVSFRCTAFTRMDGQQVEEIYAYILTVGEISSAEDEVMDQLYADIWGTAYTDSAMELLAEQIKQVSEDRAGASLEVDQTFGPGFYGMNVNTIPDFFRILDGQSIGVSVRESGFMVPQKSCAGFLITTRDKGVLPPSDCLNCLGNVGNCRLCRNYAGSKQ